jgi:Transglycosylase-like domain
MILLAAVTFASSAAAWSYHRTRSLKAWLPTARCESTYRWHIHNGNYEGGLQFDHRTWVAHGGRMYAEHAYQATPQQQVNVAARLSYDGWPSCPNPPRLR